MTFAVALAAWLAGALPATPAPPRAADAVPEVSLDMKRCAGLPSQEIVRLTGLELDARVVPLAAAGPHTTRMEVTCTGDSVAVRVWDPLTRAELTRSVQINPRDTPVAARLVALAVSELVLTSWMELTSGPAKESLPGESESKGERSSESTSRSTAKVAPPSNQPSGPPQATAVATREMEDRPPREPHLVAFPNFDRSNAAYVLLLGQATGPWTGIGTGWGTGLRLGWSSGRPWLDGQRSSAHPGVELDLGAAWGDATRPEGDLRLWMWSVAPRLSLRVRRDQLWIDLGVGVRMGVARITGAPRDPASFRGHTVHGTWAGNTVYCGVGTQWGPVVMVAGIEGGRLLRTVTGQVAGVDRASLSGSWVAGTVALGWGQ